METSAVAGEEVTKQPLWNSLAIPQSLSIELAAIALLGRCLSELNTNSQTKTYACVFITPLFMITKRQTPGKAVDEWINRL